MGTYPLPARLPAAAEEPGGGRKSKEEPGRTRKNGKAQITVTMAGLWKMRGSKNKNNKKKKPL